MADQPIQVAEIARLCEYTVDDVIPILEEGCFIPRYEPKQRDKYHKRREMTSDEKVQRRREQNRLASKRARLKKFNQKKFLRKVVDELTRTQAGLVKQLEVFGISPHMYIDGVLSPSMETSPKTVDGMNDQAKKLCERNIKLRDLLDAVSAKNASPLDTISSSNTSVSVPKLLSIPPLARGPTTTSRTNNELQQGPPLIKSVEPHKDTAKPWQSYPACPPPLPAPTDCYSCAVSMGYGCAHCGHGGAPPTYPVQQQAAPPPNGFAYPSYPMPSYYPPTQASMGCFSQWQPQQFEAVSNYSSGGYMGFSDAYMNSASTEFQMDFGGAPLAQQYTFPPPHGY